MNSQLKWIGALCTVALLSATAGDPPPVATAAMRGDIDAVKALLREGADVNAAQGDGMTALHWAAESGDAEMTVILIYAGARLEAVTRIGDYTPLHLASKSGMASTVIALLEAGSDADAATASGGALPIHFAAASGSVDAVTALLDHGSDVNVREPVRGQSPLIFAASYNRLEVLQTLIERGADVSLGTAVQDTATASTVSRIARTRRNAVLSAYRQDEEGRAASYTPSEIQAAVRAGRENLDLTEDVEEEEEEIDPDEFRFGITSGFGGMTALLHATREGHTEVALALLDAEADIEQTGTGEKMTPLLMAIINGHFDLAAELLDRGADPSFKSESGNNPLYATISAHWAAKSTGRPRQMAYAQQEHSHLDLMEKLLLLGVDPNVRLTGSPPYESRAYSGVNSNGATAFWRAAYGTDVPAMKLLVRNGADPSIATINSGRGRRFGGRNFNRNRGNPAQAAQTGNQRPGAAAVPASAQTAGQPADPRRAPRQAQGNRDPRGGGGGQQRADPSGLPAAEQGGPGVPAIIAASGVGYGQGFAGNSHRHAPDGWVPSVTYLVEVHGADVNSRDPNGYTAMHHAASRGDNEMIMFLVERGGDVTAISRRGQTVADMANAPAQRLRVFPETIALLQRLGSGFNPKPK